MPEIVKCPECKRTLRVPDDLLGKTVRCPSCQVTFTAQAGASEPPPPPMPKMEIDEGDEPATGRSAGKRDERDADRPSTRRRAEDEDRDDDREPPRFGDDEYGAIEDEINAPTEGGRAAGKRRDWLRLRQGIGLLLAAIFTIFGVQLVNCCGTIAVAGIAGAARGQGGGAAAAGGGQILLGIVVLIGLLTGLVLDVVGSIFCISAPESHGAKTLAKLSLAMKVGGILFLIIGVVMLIASIGMAVAASLKGFLEASGAGLVVIGIGYLLLLAQPVVFLFCLRGVAHVMRRDGLAQSILMLIIVHILSLVFIIGAVVLLIAGLAGGIAQGGPKGNADFLGGIGILGGIGYCLGGVLGLTFLIWYIVTLFQLRGAITNYVRRRWQRD
jgi:predicted Zn finger-like uncharacterized protein